jgi:hypothetical protein
MKFNEQCKCCGSQLTAYTHNLNAQLVQALRQLVDFYETSKRAANLQTDLKLDHNQYNNFQKLQYFGLAFRTPDGWLPEEYGIKFIYGEQAAPTTAATMGGKVIPYSDPIWKTHGTPVEWKFVKTIDEISYKKRPDYAAEKSKQASIFA